MTTKVTVVVVLPPLFVAVIVMVVDEVTAVGVPEISPVEKSKLSPAGRPNVCVHAVTVPPLYVGVTEVIAVPLVKVKEFGL